MRGRLALVSLGPGEDALIPPLAREALAASELVVGLDQYVDRVRHLLRPGRGSHAAARQRDGAGGAALSEARAGGSVALVSSGDVGVYAMASPAAGARRRRRRCGRSPGVTAAQAAASLLGSPLGHDHCSISLSDLLTPWEVIQDRVKAAAEGDFVVSLYNPRSKGRDWQLGKVKEILLEHRPPDTPVGIVKDAYRPTQRSPSRTSLLCAPRAWTCSPSSSSVAPRRGSWQAAWSPRGDIALRSVFAVTDACAGCGACLKTCPEKAIRPAPRDYSAPPRPRRPLLGMRRVRRGLPGLGLRRGSAGGRMRRVHPIETESYRILRGMVDLSHLGPLSRAVAERVIHASADLEYTESLILDEAALEGGIEALRQRRAHRYGRGDGGGRDHRPRDAMLRLRPPRRGLSENLGITRSAAGFRLAAEEVGKGAIWVVGNAPTALFELLELDVAPALVVGLPVGFVGAAESKDALVQSGLPAVANRGPKGGSAVAAAALNALIYYEEE